MTKLLLPLLLAACHERVIAVSPASEVEKPGVMTVTGTATLEVNPDCADLTMTLSADNIRPAAATSTVDAKEKALVDALVKDGVAMKDMKLSLVTLEPVYEPNQYIVIRTYRAQITVTVTTRDFGKVSQLMEAGADAGAISMSSQFRRDDLPELKKKVRDMALAAAKDKAKQTAAALGVELGKITSVGENTGGYMWNQTYFPQNAVSRDNASGNTLGGTMQNLTLDVSIGYQLKG